MEDLQVGSLLEERALRQLVVGRKIWGTLGNSKRRKDLRPTHSPSHMEASHMETEKGLDPPKPV